ncbi:MAG: sigma-54-dependent Fis family transcriptional regulator [Victivallales bacterium]|nr:sigma-54-dependent Fis family transcriptional regulator [Victivallales bacterium]
MPDLITILIIDDERNTREGLRLALEDKYHVLLAEDAFKGLELLRQNNVAIVLTDLRMPGMDGMDFIRQVSTWKHRPLIIMLTAYGSIQTALEAMKLGAYDYLTKPVDLDNLEVMLERAQKSLAGANGAPVGSAQEKVLSQIVHVSPAMKGVVESVLQVATTKATVLLTGESGTGKEVIAHAIHALSGRADKPFVPVHCAALNENLLESELFGHEKGAFTGASERVQGRFETAGDGTLFLDEIGEISLATQVKLLRVLENRTFERVGGKESLPVNARLLAATNRNLQEMVTAGTFREDLFYRLNVVSISIPPLRERREDIEPLLDFFLRKANNDNDKHIVGFAPETTKVLAAYDWPGNVRELRNCVERMVVFARGAILTMGDVPAELRTAVSKQYEEPSSNTPAQPEEPLDIHANEKSLILKALEECGGNRTHAAEKLHISRRTLQRKLRDFGINEPS